MDRYYYRISCEYKPGRSEAAEGENALVVDISDALSERDKVKFTVHTKVRHDQMQSAN
jgi:hypothetical protein